MTCSGCEGWERMRCSVMDGIWCEGMLLSLWRDAVLLVAFFGKSDVGEVGERALTNTMVIARMVHPVNSTAIIVIRNTMYQGNAFNDLLN